MRQEKDVIQLEISSGDELVLSCDSLTDSEAEYCEAIKTSDMNIKNVVKMTRGIQKTTEKVITKKRLKCTIWTDMKLKLVPLPPISRLKSIRYFDLQFPLDEQLFCDGQNHKLVNVYDMSSFKKISGISYDVENGLYQVNIQEKKFFNELYQHFEIQKKYYCNWLKSVGTNKAFKMIEVQDMIEKTHMLGTLQKQGKDSLGNDSIQTQYPADNEWSELKKLLPKGFIEKDYDDQIQDCDQTVDGDQNTLTYIKFDELLDGFTKGQPYMTRLYKLEKNNSTIENVLIQEEYSIEFMKQILQLGDDHEQNYDFQAKNGGFKTIFFDDMVSSLYKIYVQPDCKLLTLDDDKTVMTLDDSNSQCSYTAIIVKDQENYSFEFKNYKKFWKIEGCVYCKHYLTTLR